MKLLNSQTECMMIYNYLFEQAQCKLLNIIEQTASQIYEIICDEILLNVIQQKLEDKPQNKIFEALLNIISSHMMMTSKRNKPFTSGLNYVLIKMMKYINTSK